MGPLPLHLPRFKIRIKFVILFVLIGLLPLTLVMTVTISRLRNIQKGNAVRLNQKVAEEIGTRIDAFILQQRGLLKNLATIYPHPSQESQLPLDLLKTVLYRNDDFINLAIVDASGMEVRKEDKFNVITPGDLKDRRTSREFQSVLTEGYFLGPVEIINGRPIFSIGEAIKGLDNDFKGAVFAQIDSRVMQNVIAQITSEGQKHAYVVSLEGKIVAHPDISQVLSQKDVSNIPIVRSMIKKDIVVDPLTIYKNDLGLEVLGGVVPIMNTEWSVIVEQPASLALEPVNKITTFSLNALALVLAIAFFLALLSAYQVVKPLEQLHQASLKFSEGQLDYRINVSTNDEIEDLAHGFNQMAENLKKNITQLTFQNKLLMALRNLDKAALSTLEVKPLSQSAVDLISQVLGYMFGVIALVTPDGKGIQRIAISRTQDEQLRKALDIIPIPFHQQVVDMSVSENLLVRVVKERRSFVTDNIRDFQIGILPADVSAKIQELLNIKRAYAYPLATKDRVLGAIYYGSVSDKLVVSQEEYVIMEEFAHEVARALDNALLYQNVKSDKEIMAGERNKLAITLSAITDGVVAVDMDRRIIIFNKAAQEITGYKEDQVIGQKIEDVIKIVDEEEEITGLTYCPIRTDSFEGIVYSKRGLKIIGAGQRRAYINLVSGQIKEGGNINLGCILTIHDVTEEKELEQMKLDFVSMAAHELRTPLTAIKGYIHVFSKTFTTPPSDQQKTYLLRMNIATQRLVALVENLLNVSRIEKGTLTLRLEEIDWVENVKEIAAELLDQARDKNQELVVIEPIEPLPKVKADKFRINEVLTNLLSNAVSYTLPGGKIKVWFDATPNEVITHVQDNGPGIPKEALPRLFTMFFRVTGALEQGSKGTGLGLYISKSIVELHKGKIWAQSQEGQGSTFSFSIPIKDNLINPLHKLQAGQVYIGAL